MTHAEKLARIEVLMASPDVIELDALSTEVEAFEKQAFPVPAPTLAEAMKFRRDQTGETRKQIATRADIPLSHWKWLESGNWQPTFDDAKRLYAIGIPASVLLAP